MYKNLSESATAPDGQNGYWFASIVKSDSRNQPVIQAKVYNTDLYAIPHVTKRKMDSERKSRYYAVILSGKEDCGQWSIKYSNALCQLTALMRHAGKLR